jgi:DNA-binding MarR family transcriptional regulator
MNDYTLPTKFDRLIHQPARLAIMAVLAGCKSADFTYLLGVTDLNKGTLSKHLSYLEEAGYIDIEKSFKGKYPNTTASLTSEGRRAFKRYRRQYRAFNKALGDDV